MNVLLAGLSLRDETALGIFLTRFMGGWTWQAVLPHLEEPLPRADLIVADLVAWGLGKWSPMAEINLLQRLHGTPAVLLVPSTNRTWTSMDTSTCKLHSLFWLAKPYDSEDMRTALDTVATAVKHKALTVAQAPAARPVARGLPAVIPTPAAPVSAVVTSRPPVPTHVAPGAMESMKVEPSLTAAELQSRLASLRVIGRFAFLRKLSVMLELGQPFEARFTFQHLLVVHPSDGWIATNTPMSVIERVCLSDTLASVVVLQRIDEHGAEARLPQMGVPPVDLDTFLWELAHATLDHNPT